MVVYGDLIDSTFTDRSVVIVVHNNSYTKLNWSTYNDHPYILHKPFDKPSKNLSICIYIVL